ncbi:magnesium transporter [Salinarimonas sp. NSM]|uniref:magnesium transporter n=1 Tax=Salinarimonas sp. NSM TaxID=3458003 RepID=UPI004035D2C1
MAEADDTLAPETAPLGASEPAPPPVFRDEEHGGVSRAFLEAVREALEAQDGERLRALVGDLHESDLGDLIEALDQEERRALMVLFGPDLDFTALTEVDETIRVALLRELPTTLVVEGMRELDIDDAVYILEDLDDEEKFEILQQLPVMERAALQRSLDLPEDAAGRRMQTQFIAVPPFWTVGQTIDFMRESQDLPETFYEIYVVDPTVRLKGSVSLDRILRTQRPKRIAEIMKPAEHAILATDAQEEAARIFQRYNLVSAAVVDAAGRMVGVITVDDIVDVLEEEADADIKALGGVKADEELSDSVWYITRSRFTWLFVNLLTAILASVVIGVFADALEQMVALAVLMPIVASMGGNAGTQTMTVAVRALGTRQLSRANAMRIVRREMVVGLLNGVAFAVVMGIVAAVWFDLPSLGPVIGLALVITLVSAALGGIVIPLLLDRFKIDPAVSSGPFVTTVTDVVGFFAFLGIASAWFGI